MTADVITLTAPNGATAQIAPQRGFNLYRLALPAQGQDEPVEALAAEADFPAGGKPSHSGIPLLFPFPNRIKAGEFTTDQQSEHLLPLGDGPGEAKSDGAGNAIHGFAFDRAWTVTAQDERSATATFTLSENDPERASLWPGDGRLTVAYELTGDGLRCDLTVENLGDEPLPFGLGTHPYFKLPVGPSSGENSGTAADCTVTVPAAARYELIGGVPTGEVVALDEGYDLQHGPAFGGLKLDDVYTQVSAKADEPGVIESVIENPANGLRIVQRCDAAFREQVVFTPPWFREGDAGSICIEPYTCATDAVNLAGRGVDAGWRTLAPGDRFETWFEIAVQ
ncbi:aldose 1-epimerase [Alienimonas californiensis]|uniref:Aldose 1-epimerase n=1 Tax=Alienimonas californiensis TaxID=2527989 RepID=A0A517P8S4_9PLAN|nr:aldose 1-epimerase [Alienimonas californiensis]QDT15779.1 Aldose 1-epimerase [Alienimonas californiensis]